MPKSCVTWFILAGIWILTAIVHIFEHASSIRIGYDILAASLFIFLGFAHRYYAPKGVAGKKKLKRITIISCILFLLLVVIILIAF